MTFECCILLHVLSLAHVEGSAFSESLIRVCCRRTEHVIEFNNINDWSPTLSDALSDLVSDDVRQKLRAASSDYVEDALDLLLNLAGADAIIDATLGVIRSEEIAAYHGSRLIAADVDSIRSVGLLPLKAEDRRCRLVRALSPHPQWPLVSHRLDEVIRDLGEGCAVGLRVGQVHLTLSRAGLTDAFDHYLTYGAEFDQHVARCLLGKDGLELLSQDGQARIVHVAVPGAIALDAAHQYFSIDDVRARGEVPNLVREFLSAWSYGLAPPEFHTATLVFDCGMVFRVPVPASWIIKIETITPHATAARP